MPHSSPLHNPPSSPGDINPETLPPPPGSPGSPSFADVVKGKPLIARRPFQAARRTVSGPTGIPKDNQVIGPRPRLDSDTATRYAGAGNRFRQLEIETPTKPGEDDLYLPEREEQQSPTPGRKNTAMGPLPERTPLEGRLTTAATITRDPLARAPASPQPPPPLQLSNEMGTKKDAVTMPQPPPNHLVRATATSSSARPVQNDVTPTSTTPERKRKRPRTGTISRVNYPTITPSGSDARWMQELQGPALGPSLRSETQERTNAPAQPLSGPKHLPRLPLSHHSHHRPQPVTHTAMETTAPLLPTRRGILSPPSPHLRDDDYGDTPISTNEDAGGDAQRIWRAPQQDNYYPNVLGPQATTPLGPVQPVYSFTPTPATGFPIIHRMHPEGLLADLDPARIRTIWSDASAALVEVWNVNYPGSNRMRSMTTALMNAIEHITGEHDFIAVPPNLRDSRPSIRWTITFFAYTRTLHIPRYLFTLTNFANNHRGAIEEAVRTAFGGPTIARTIRQLAQRNPDYAHLPAEEAAELIVASVEVRVDELSNGNLHAAVFCDPPTASADRWTRWRDWLMTLPYECRFNPPGYAIELL
ncbi:hypothetical protein OH77DRAFT_1526111 [Trametes cingulata]|nr:hypothetical protein OH77DRAFT_1526111 [Trametes cingulata]